MNDFLTKKHLKYIFTFSTIYLISYCLVAVIFNLVQNLFDANQIEAILFFKPYSFPTISVIVNQFLKGGFLALIIYPFYDLIYKKKRSILYLFILLWGLTLFGSVQPMPGSIEGIYYTKTTILEHLLVLSSKAIQILVFSKIFLRQEKGEVLKESEVKEDEEKVMWVFR